MGLFAKIKTIFYDDVSEDTEQKNEPKKEIKKDIRKEIEFATEEIKFPQEVKKIKDEVIEEVKTDNTFSERELFRTERTFNFTEFDDEEDAKPRNNVLNIEKRISRTDTAPVIEKPKAFKPSPVISPIYGILDKDYTKSDVTLKKVAPKPVELPKKDYDSVRRKAFGTLEDQLEDTMIRTPLEVKESVDNIEDDIDELNEKTAKIEDLINRIENTNNDITIGDLEEKAKDEVYDDSDSDSELEIEDEDDDKTITDDTLEHDLFNLIDSMYDDKEE